VSQKRPSGASFAIMVTMIDKQAVPTKLLWMDLEMTGLDAGNDVILEVAAEITSARELSAAEMSELRSILKDKLGREPRITTHVDPKLLGGLVLKVGSRMIDSSLRTKLDTLRAAMKGQ